MPKISVRKRQLAQREALSPEECRRASRLITQRLAQLPEYLAARTVALYSPIRNEVDISGLLPAALSAGKRVVYPRVRDTEIDFHVITSLTQLHPGGFGVAEPLAGEVVAVAKIDLLVVPGVAFDGNGHRLGYGKGYYDRVLARLKKQTAVGVAYRVQLVDALPTEGHDQRLNVLVTEETIQRFPD